MSNDPVNHPKHYTEHPSGVECIQITEHMGFNLGNAMKYIWRADLKHDAIEDMRKAVWYIEREIAKRAAKAVPTDTRAMPPAAPTDTRAIPPAAPATRLVMPAYDGEYRVFLTDGSTANAVFKENKWYFISGALIDIALTHWSQLNDSMASEQWRNADIETPTVTATYRVQFKDGRYDRAIWDGAWYTSRIVSRWAPI